MKATPSQEDSLSAVQTPLRKLGAESLQGMLPGAKASWDPGLGAMYFVLPAQANEEAALDAFDSKFPLLPASNRGSWKEKNEETYGSPSPPPPSYHHQCHHCSFLPLIQLFLLF